MSKRLTVRQKRIRKNLRKSVREAKLHQEAYQTGKQAGYDQGLADAKKVVNDVARAKVLEASLDMVKHASQTYLSIAESYSRVLMNCSAVIDELKGV